MSKNNIVLIGMPGCGKSSIGLMVSKILNTDFYDLDKYIEDKAQTTIPEIFKIGEDHFRNLECNAVREIYHKQSIVISTGGGIVTRQENMTRLKQTGIIFYIERPLEMIIESSDFTTRPLLTGDNNKIYTLYEERKHLYEQYCDFRITNDQSIEEATELVIKLFREHDKNHYHSK